MIPKQFSVDVLVSDDEIKQTAGDENLLHIIWVRFPSIRSEFADDFKIFVAFARSIVEGRSKVCNGGTVSGRQTERVSLAQ